MENLSEKALQALNKVVIAKSEIDVFDILNDYNIDHFEGQMLLNIFHEADAHRQKAVNENNNKKREMKIKQLKKKHDYLQQLTNNQIEVFYAHLLFEKKADDILNTYYEHLVSDCAHKRSIKRMKMKAKELGISEVAYDDKIRRNSLSRGYGDIEYTPQVIANLAGSCEKCEQLIVCKCK